MLVLALLLAQLEPCSGEAVAVAVGGALAVSLEIVEPALVVAASVLVAAKTADFEAAWVVAVAIEAAFAAVNAAAAAAFAAAAAAFAAVVASSWAVALGVVLVADSAVASSHSVASAE